MSFILDALKKSELERQRQTVPGLMDTPPRARRSRLPKWAMALGALLAVNLAVLTVILVKRPAADHAARASQAPARSVPRAAAAPRPDKPFSPMDGAPVYAPEIPVADQPAAGRAAPDARAPAGRGASAGSAADLPPRRPDPLLTQPDPAENQEVLPTISEMSAQGLPDLHLDVHVYATRAADRFVYINMRRYHEGAVLQEGPTLEHIRRDGVVLNYQGLRFLLPRQP